MAEPLNIPPQVIQAVQQGKLIEAIKYLRQHKPQLGLAEAKALIEAIQKQGSAAVSPAAQQAAAKAKSVVRPAATVHHHHAPPLPQSIMDPNVSPGEVPRTGGTGFLFVLVAIAVVIAVAVYFGR